jgi:hypothetical protein
LDLIDACMQAISQCALVVSDENKQRVLKWLLRQIRKGNNDVSGESLTAIRHLIQQNPRGHISTIRVLAQCLEKEMNSRAKAAVIWIVGEYVPLAPTIGPDVLRRCVPSFAEEPEIVRYQLLVLAAKLQAYYSSKEDEDEATRRVSKLYDHVIHLSRYDTSYDTRDRCRMFSSLLASSLSKEIGTLILQAPKPMPAFKDGATLDRSLLLGTSSLLFGYPLGKYSDLPVWTKSEHLIDSSVRNEQLVTKATGIEPSLSSLRSISHKDTQMTPSPSVNGQRTAKAQTLDEFFADVEPVVGGTADVEAYTTSSDEYEEDDDEEDDEEEDGEDEDDEKEDEEDDEDDEEEEEEEEEHKEEDKEAEEEEKREAAKN